MRKLKIVICTRAKTDLEFSKRPIFLSLQKQCVTNPQIEYIVFKDNKRGLSVNYNEALTDHANRDSILLFVHDDVVLEDLFLYEKLIDSPYSITGLAGAKTFNKHAQHLSWHNASNQSDHVGEVAHWAPQNGMWTTRFGQTTSRALILDGLFLSCKVNELVDSQLTFDSEFDFHFYDIAFCLRANQKKVTCGVLPIRVIHYGLGDSMNSDEWAKSCKLFKKKY